MRELKIEPQFRDLIPKLTDEEFKQLEKNILEDGKVNQPIVVWNDVIVDGHHRYYVVQKHPEIPFEVEERDFPNEYAAMAWACNEQLGRRNLNPRDRAYLIGKQYESEKMAHGGDRKSEKSSCRSDNLIQQGERTSEKIAKEYGIGEKTVSRAEEFAKGIDIAEETIPGIKEKILHDDKVNIPKNLVRGLLNAKPEAQKVIVQAMSDAKDIQSIKAVYRKLGVNYEDSHNPTTHRNKTVLVTKPEESEPYNADDMLDSIRYANSNFEAVLKQNIVVLHNDVLNTKEGRKKTLTGLAESQEIIDKYINIIKAMEDRQANDIC